MKLSNKQTAILFNGVIFLGAFLLFLLEPLTGKMVMAQYGGVAQIWIVCLLFFQLSLLGGYAISFLIARLQPKQQITIYAALMGLSLLFIRLPYGTQWNSNDFSNPAVNLLMVLIGALALPAIFLSTISTLFQNWFKTSDLGEPYHLYSISNVGSLGALLLYPALIESNFTIPQTILLWQVGYFLLLILAAIAIWQVYQRKDTTSVLKADEVPSAAPKLKNYAFWTGLSALGSLLLASFTVHLTQDLAPVPMLWVIPLGIYLLTFILCFQEKSKYNPSFYYAVSLLLPVVYFLLIPLRLGSDTILLIGLFQLFVCCMVCHGEIYENRPAPRYLTHFYLSIAFGGTLGGVFANFIAPLLFKTHFEQTLAITATILVIIVLSVIHERRTFTNMCIEKVFVVLLLVLVVNEFTPKKQQGIKDISQERNFYSALVVKQTAELRVLMNGSTVHGTQMLKPEMRNTPTTYYMRNSSIDLATQYMRPKRKDQLLNVGVIGLGAGCVASYANNKDHFVFYELDPKMEKIANQFFTFIPEAKARNANIEIRLGDARRVLQQEAPQQYDILMVDAFSSDSIPVHLLTQESLALYQSHLNPDGLLLYHISNRYLSLNKVLENMALAHHLNAVQTGAFPMHPYEQTNIYEVLSNSDEFTQFVAHLDKKTYPNVKYTLAPQGGHPGIGVWTDDFSNLLSVMDFPWVITLMKLLRGH